MIMDIDEAGPDQSSLSCRIAVVGSQFQRMAKVIALLGAEKYQRSTIISRDSTASSPLTVDIEYLPCVATFDSYEDERGRMVRYLAKMEYYEPGKLVGKSLAPFFDDVYSARENIDGDGGEIPFPGIAAFAIGCGIENDEDVSKIQRFLETLSSSCAAQISQPAKMTDDYECKFGIAIACIKPNPEYASLADENKAFRELNENDRKEAVAKGLMGPGKMANFVYTTAQSVIRQRLSKPTEGFQQPRNGENAERTSSIQLPTFGQKMPDDEITKVAPALDRNTPDSQTTRYACRICRSVLFGIEDQEDPPHSQSLHDFRKKRQKVGHCTSGTCQNYFIAQPLPWMNGCSDVEGKLHCPKCKTKVGHYSWTGAQCSCGTWVTPAIMVPFSKVDEMKPISTAVVMVTGSSLCHPLSQHEANLSSAVWNDSSDSVMDVTDN
jgi:dual specificity phosphatase 12